MKYGIFGGAVSTGTIDDVVAQAAAVERDGFASYWAPNIFGHDALTALAVVGAQVPRIELGTAVVPTYPRAPARHRPAVAHRGRRLQATGSPSASG